MAITGNDLAASKQIEREAATKRGDGEGRVRKVTLYVCVNGCDTAHATSEHLEEQWTGYRGQNGEVWPKRARTRAVCHVCDAQRVRVTASVLLPREAPERPPIPQHILDLQPNPA